jgi:hypothetical protein
MDLLNEMEAVFPVEQWTVGDLHVWPIVRIKLAFDLAAAYHFGSTWKPNGSTLLRTARQSRAALAGLARFAHAYWTDYKHNDWPTKKVDAVLLSDGISYTCIRGLWHEKFLEPILERFQREGASHFLMSPLHEYFTPRQSRSMFVQPHLDLATTKSVVRTAIRNPPDEHLPGFEELSDLWKAKALPVSPITREEIGRRAGMVKGLAKFYAGILKRIEPSLGLVVSYYGTTGMAFNLACRRHGIPVVDIQHGVQGELHFAYGRWNKVPERGYELLPSLFWCWSDREAAIINRWSLKVPSWHKPVVGGNTWLARWKQGKADFIAYYDKKVLEMKWSTQKFAHILVTLQFGLAPENMNPIFQAMKKAPPSWRWWIRLHPAMLDRKSEIKQELDNCGITDYELDEATDLPLCALLGHCDVHVTHSSSTVIEAEYFEVPSVLTSEYGVELYPDHIRSGWAISASTAEEIARAILVQLNRKQSLTQLEPSSRSYDNDGMTLVLNLLKARRNGDLLDEGENGI